MVTSAKETPIRQLPSVYISLGHLHYPACLVAPTLPGSPSHPTPFAAPPLPMCNMELSRFT